LFAREWADANQHLALVRLFAENAFGEKDGFVDRCFETAREALEEGARSGVGG
jgi:hypothetical protein